MAILRLSPNRPRNRGVVEVKRSLSGILCVVASIAACSGGASLNILGPELFTYTATSQVTSTSPMRFQTTVTVRNPTTDEIEFDVSPCNHPRVLVYSTAARSGPAVWDSNSRAIVCSLPITTVRLAGGASVSYTQTVTGAEVLGPSGSAGADYITSQVALKSG